MIIIHPSKMKVLASAILFPKTGWREKHAAFLLYYEKAFLSTSACHISGPCRRVTASPKRHVALPIETFGAAPEGIDTWCGIPCRTNGFLGAIFGGAIDLYRSSRWAFKTRNQKYGVYLITLINSRNWGELTRFSTYIGIISPLINGVFRGP